MSNNNPYAVNGYGGGSTQNNSNPYGSNPYATNTSNNDPYLNQNNGSTPSYNSYATRPSGERRPTNSGPSVNPYGRAPPPRRDRPPIPSGPPGPQNLGGIYDTSNPLLRSPRPEYTQNDGSASRGGYGGLGPPEPDYDRRQGPGSRPGTSGQDRDPRDYERGGISNDGWNRDRRADSGARDMLPPPNRPPIPRPADSSLAPANGAYGANRQYSPRRPTKSMDEILRHIQSNWRIMEGDECVPVKVALQLADPSSLGLGDKEADFADTHVDLQKSLKAVVNEHYADFNSAVGTYHKIQASIRESQSRVRYLKTGLATVKGGMLTTRPELRELAEQSGQLDELLLVVSQMESLRELPAKLEEKINEKRWIGAADILGEALVNCRKKGLDEIGAMSDLRGYFANQESSLIDMLIEELHDHLYLKSPYCSQRWKGRKVDGTNGAEANARDSFGGNAWDRPVYRFLASLDTKEPMTEDASKNPESDTFYYMQMITEALHRRGYLEELVTRIEQRMPVELYKVVERTHQEIDAKYPNHLRNTMNKSKDGPPSLHTSETDTKILSDLLWTLYAKFEAIAEGHRVLHEVIMGITEREKMSKPERYGSSFKELWKLYQMEIRSLLHDYLATDGDVGIAGGKHSIVAGDVFSKLPRDKSKRMFKLAEMDQKSSDIKIEEEELDEILKSSVPGLVTKSKNNEDHNTSSGRGDLDGTAAGHKLLIEPSVFNMTVLLPPSLTFLQHLKDIVPQTSKIAMSTLTSFLDDFLINVFHPQLEEAVTDLCTESMLDYEAFMEDPQWRLHAPHPIFKGTIDFMSLVHAFSTMLSQIPSDQMFTQLIITQLYKYYDRCYGFYKNIVSRVSQANQAGGVVTTIMKAAAGHAEEGDIRETTVPLWTNREMDRAARADLMRKEVNLLIAASKANPIQPYDIISDPKSIHQLSLIYNSMQWLSASLDRLRNARPKSIKSHSRNPSLTGPLNPRRWTLITNLNTGIDPDALNAQEAPVYLPLTKETKVPFNETLTYFRSLASKALLTLHLDIRCGIIHQLTKSLKPQIPTENPASPVVPGVSTPTTGPPRESTPPPLDSGVYPFVLTAPPTSASPMVLELNNDLIHFDASISSYLGTRERLFILRGLGRLVDRYLVVGADFVGVMNQHGAERMRVDGMVVQQVLRGLGVTASSSATQPNNNPTSSNGFSSKSPPTSPPQSPQRTRAPSGLGITSPSSPNSNSKIPIDLAPKNPASISTVIAPTTDVDEEDALLLSSSQYYTLFLSGPDAIMAYVKMKKAAALQKKNDIGYTYDEFRTLIELCFSAAIRGEDREESLKAKKKMGDLLLNLGEVMWDS